MATMTASSISEEVSLAPNKMLAVAELMVSLHSFVNIELHAQGWYAIRISVEPEPELMAVVPTVVYCGDESVPPKYAAMVDEAHGVYQSRTFSVRYCYEEVALRETVSFILYVTRLQELEHFSCVLDIELLLHEADLQLPDLEPPTFHLRPIAREQLHISRVATGLLAYHTATFDIHHYCLCHMGVFATTRGFATTDVLGGLPVMPGLKSVTSASRSRSGNLEDASPRSSWAATLLGAPLCRAGSADVFRAEALGMVAADGERRSYLSCGSRKGSKCRNASPTAIMARAVRTCHLVMPGDDSLLREALQEVTDASVKGGGKSAAVSDDVKMERLAALFKVTAGALQQTAKSLVDQLRQLPLSCYAPQTLSTIRALLAIEVHGASNSSTESSTATPSPPPHPGLAKCNSEGSASMTRRVPPAPAGPGHAQNGHSQAAGLKPSPGARPPADPNLRRHAHRHEALAASLGMPNSHEALRRRPAAHDWQSFLKTLPANCSPGAAVLHLESLLHQLRDNMSLDWGVLLWLLRHSPRELLQYLRSQWEAEQQRLTRLWLVHHALLPFGEGGSRASEVSQCRQMLRQQGSAMCDEHTRILLLPSWGYPAQQPILFVDSSKARDWTHDVAKKAFGTNSPKDEMHVVVFVHGFQGAASDLSLVKGQMSMMYPYLECFLSRANEGNTADSIEEMGGRLAQELCDFLTPLVQSSPRPLTRISFVGHSIGNLILRAALTTPTLAPYLSLLWMYLSISGPHMGFLYSSNAVLDTGMRVLKSLGRGKCLHQLSFTDACNQRECYLYHLSQHEIGLSAFRHVVLVYSPQDRYVPLHSAQISMCDAAVKDGKKGAVCNEMVHALLKNMGGPNQTRLWRVDVDFELEHKSFSLSKLVGRTAHIEFLECKSYVCSLMWGVLHHNHLLHPVDNAWL